MLKRSLLLSLLLAAGAVQAEQTKPDLEKGKATAEGICAGCHAPDGNSQLPANPKLAGQIPEYLAKQLHEFQSKDGAAPVRVNAVMNGMSAALSPEDIVNVSAYFAAQKLEPSVAKNGETVEWGQKLWRAGDASKGLPACAACHGPAGMGMPAQFPRLSGQFAEYTAAQLRAFRAEERGNDPAKMMREIALKMTDKEIDAVSDFIAGLR